MTRALLLFFLLIAATGVTAKGCKNVDDGDWPRYMKCVDELDAKLGKQMKSKIQQLMSIPGVEDDRGFREAFFRSQEAWEIYSETHCGISSSPSRTYSTACMNGKRKQRILEIQEMIIVNSRR